MYTPSSDTAASTMTHQTDQTLKRTVIRNQLTYIPPCPLSSKLFCMHACVCVCCLKPEWAEKTPYLDQKKMTEQAQGAEGLNYRVVCLRTSLHTQTYPATTAG